MTTDQRAATGPAMATRGRTREGTPGPPCVFQGIARMSSDTIGRHVGCMPSYLLEHRHDARECGVVFAAFNGRESPLRRATLLGRSGGHAIWWRSVASDRRPR